MCVHENTMYMIMLHMLIGLENRKCYQTQSILVKNLLSRTGERNKFLSPVDDVVLREKVIKRNF